MSEPKTNTLDDASNQQAATFRRLHPKAYLERFIAEKFRPDGRELNEWRDISVNVGESNAALQALLIPDFFLSIRFNLHRRWIGVGSGRRHDCRLRCKSRDRGT